ncbi:MAG TPA: DNA-3-methyladenine glycosylase I [Candidatus Limnocylindrales bacterium]|nr:DNA-3-methyladenine glycosylase I [Candidatus Limnocylindrales bacterium]
MASPSAGIVVGIDGVPRCWWGAGDPLYRRYHDREWGRPVKDDRRLFEKICLEGFQSGLSWLTILRKRDNFRRAFEGFDIEAVAGFNARRVETLMADTGIVRNRAKILSTIANARHCLALIEECGSLAAYAWSFEPRAGSRPTRLEQSTLARLATSDRAKAMSTDLKHRGFTFVGETTVYAFMQAVGLVNDHLTGCQMRDEVDRLRAAFVRPRRPAASPARAASATRARRRSAARR